MGTKGGCWRRLGSYLRGRRGIPGERMGNEGRWMSLRGQAPLIKFQANTQSLSQSPSGAMAGMSLLLQHSSGERGRRAKAVWTGAQQVRPQVGRGHMGLEPPTRSDGSWVRAHRGGASAAQPGRQHTCRAAHLSRAAFFLEGQSTNATSPSNSS